MAHAVVSFIAGLLLGNQACPTPAPTPKKKRNSLNLDAEQSYFIGWTGTTHEINEIRIVDSEDADQPFDPDSPYHVFEVAGVWRAVTLNQSTTISSPGQALLFVEPEQGKLVLPTGPATHDVLDIPEGTTVLQAPAVPGEVTRALLAVGTSYTVTWDPDDEIHVFDPPLVPI